MPSQLILGPIVGGLSDTSVNLWGRSNAPGSLRAWVGKKENLSDARLAATSAPLQPQDAFTGVAPVRGLTPETTYYYDLRLDDDPPPVAGKYSKFTTFPSPGEARDFSFVFGSCFRPARENGLIFKSIENQRASAEEDNQPDKKLRFILFIGDQVYSDDRKYNGLKEFGQHKERGAVTLEEYRNVYQYTWQNEHIRPLLKNLPAFMTLDDHEVDDDWRWTNLERSRATFSILTRLIRWFQFRPAEERNLSPARVRNALQAYWEHQGMHAPPMNIPPQFDATGQYTLERHDPGSLAYTFTYGAAAFFVLDTRTMRVKNSREHRMLGDGQWHVLKEWLREVKDKFPLKFLLSSSSVLYSMFGDFLGDRWSGFRRERDELLRFIGDQHIRNVYLLTGDLHSAHSMTADCGPHDSPTLLHEFCSTPFEQACNSFARWMYTSIKTGAVHHPKRQFVVTKPNYGLVSVRFRDGTPQVEFRLYGTEGQLLAPLEN